MDPLPPDLPNRPTAPYTILLDGKRIDAAIMPAIAAVASEFPGTHPLVIDAGTGRLITLGQNVDPTPEFIASLRRLLRQYVRR